MNKYYYITFFVTGSSFCSIRAADVISARALLKSFKNHVELCPVKLDYLQ